MFGVESTLMAPFLCEIKMGDYSALNRSLVALTSHFLK